MKTLHAAHLGTLFLGMALASATVFAGDGSGHHGRKGGAVTHAQWAHGTAEKNFGVIRQVKQAEDLGILGGSAPQSAPGGTPTGDEPSQ